MTRVLTSEVPAYIGLGANLGDPVAQLRSGVTALGRLPATRVERCSSFYRTAPVGIEEQPDFINAVCRVSTGLDADALMRELLAIERMHGRSRRVPPGGPRTLDLDLLVYGEEVRASGELVLPHPRLHERAFVLYPLMEIAPALVIPGKGRVADLVGRCASQRLERLSGQAAPDC